MQFIFIRYEFLYLEYFYKPPFLSIFISIRVVDDVECSFIHSNLSTFGAPQRVIFTSLWKESLNSDGQQLHQCIYQQNQQN